MEKRRNPAVVAGLTGVALAAVPQPARALSLEDLAGLIDPVSAPGIALAAALAGGALVVGGVACAVVSRRSARVEGAAEAEGAAKTNDAAAAADASGALELPRFERSVEDTLGGSQSVYVPRHMRVLTPEELKAREEERKEEREEAPAAHAARTYEDIAANYASKVSFRERMTRRAQGVAATLRDRMGAGMMDGVPVISRADGTVGDVGTSWWTAAVGAEAISPTSGFAPEEESDLAIPSDFTLTGRELLVSAAERRRDAISGRVAFVDEGVYPERRTVDDLAAEDEWASALKSMEENLFTILPQRDPVEFSDVAGGIDTIDEPDGLEPDTNFIPFRTPAGHPEVVDVASYVDYLVEDECSKNPCPAIRRGGRRSLQVLDGGTSASSSLYVGKHFAPSKGARARAVV